jgi:hypothetical protein
MSIRQLKRILPPPADPLDTAADWARVEATMGIALPDDYKEFVRVYGKGRICDFIRVHVPSAKEDGANLLWCFDKQLGALRTIREEFPELCAFDAFPAPGGLIPWGLQTMAMACIGFLRRSGGSSSWIATTKNPSFTMGL